MNEDKKKNGQQPVPTAQATAGAPVSAARPSPTARPDLAVQQTALQGALDEAQAAAPTRTAPRQTNKAPGAFAPQQTAQQAAAQPQQTAQQAAETALNNEVAAQSAAQPRESGTATGASEPVQYTDPNGAQQTGYLIDGRTYTDPNGTQTVPVGSVVTTPDGKQWYKASDDNSVEQIDAYYTDENGNRATGYLIDGIVYADREGTQPLPPGSVAATSDGQYVQQGDGQAYFISREEYERNLSDLSDLIRQEYAAADEAAKTAINYATQEGVDQLNRAMQDAQPSYEAAIANQLMETRQAQDAQALRNQVNGDRGGIGSAQVDSIINTGAWNREAIATQQRQLATDTARQIADLRAQGKYQEAAALLQNAQQRLAALYQEGVRLQQEQLRSKETLGTYANAFLNAGVVPPDNVLNAIGMSREDAQLYIDAARAQQEQARAQEDDARVRENLAAYANAFLNAGVVPPDNILDAVGLTREDAQAIIDAAAKASGSSGSGNGGSSGSGNGGNGNGGNTGDTGDPGDGEFVYGNGLNPDNYAWLSGELIRLYKSGSDDDVKRADWLLDTYSSAMSETQATQLIKNLEANGIYLGKP